MPQTGREQTLKSCCAVTRGHKSGRGRFRVPQRQGFGTGMEVGEGLGFAECVRNVDPQSGRYQPLSEGICTALVEHSRPFAPGCDVVPVFEPVLPSPSAIRARSRAAYMRSVMSMNSPASSRSAPEPMTVS